MSDSDWHKSSFSFSNGNCAEVRQLDRIPGGTVVAVRDSQDRDGPVLVFGAAAWGAFLAMVRQT